MRGGVQMMLSEGSLEEWICLSCATKLAQKLQEAVAACRWHMKRGEIYRDERWQKGERST